MKKFNVAIMGLGVVGGGVADVLAARRAEFAARYGTDVRVVCVLDRNEARVRQKAPDAKFVSSVDDLLAMPIDAVVETMGGTEPARSYMLQCLQKGLPVVTANKELLAKHATELAEAAKSSGAGLFFEASALGGVPVIRTLTQSMQANTITALYGIVNGTTNYVLSQMASNNISYAAALDDARERGYAEADPAADVEGRDAVYKLCILSRLAFRAAVQPRDVFCEGITAVSAADVAAAKREGCAVKLLAAGKRTDGGLSLWVRPTRVPLSHPLARVDNVFNALYLRGDFVGDIMLYGRGAGAHPTASAIVSDLVCCALGAKGDGEALLCPSATLARVQKGVHKFADL